MKKRILSIVAVSVMAVSLVACGDSSKKAATSSNGTTVKDVVKKMNKATQEGTGSDITGSIDFKASIEQDGEKYDMTVSGTMDVQATNEPVVSHIKTDMEMNMAGMSQPLATEMYTSQDEDGNTTTYVSQSGKWVKSTVEADESSTEMIDAMSDISKYITDENIKKYFDNVKLKEEKKDGTDCYVVSGTLKENAFEDLLNASKEITGDSVDESSIPDITMPIKVYIDKKTYLPKEVTVNIEMEKTDGMEIKKAEIKMTSNSYNVDSIEIPEDALNASEE